MPLDPPKRALRPRPLMRRLALPAVLCGTLFGACTIDPERPKLRFELNELTTAVEEPSGAPIVPPDVQEHMYGALAMLFGQPSDPRFMLTEQWVEEGFNPNYPQYPEGDDGSGDLSESRLEELYADNQRAFAEQLAAIEAGDYAGVRLPRSAPGLERIWREDVLDAIAAEGWQDSPEFKGEAAAIFAEYYPSFADSAELYRVQCLHCHGVSGGGDGPTADFLKPRPRDYRQGKFKFTAVRDKARPRRADLYRIIEQGATGTAMPSFMRLSQAQIEGLVDYVRLLAIRGETELYMLTLAEEEDWRLSLAMVQDAYASVWERWLGNADKLIAWEGPIPEPTPASIERGKLVYNDATTGNCTSCHGTTGLGNGPAAMVVDAETKALARDPRTKEPVSAYNDDWGHPILPRNLQLGIFRGGRRPIDIYRRIYAGINGTPMPALGGALPDEDIWALVHYVGTLSELHAHEHAAGQAPH